LEKATGDRLFAFITFGGAGILGAYLLCLFVCTPLIVLDAWKISFPENRQRSWLVWRKRLQVGMGLVVVFAVIGLGISLAGYAARFKSEEAVTFLRWGYFSTFMASLAATFTAGPLRSKRSVN
ncbi:MAG: hypothetical protein C0478_10225, partial [Planctomyces sp.]|nr:hypothetical protein [Planctomyces sp.]